MNAQQEKRWSGPRYHCSCSCENLVDGGGVDIDNDVCIISYVIDDTDLTLTMMLVSFLMSLMIQIMMMLDYRQ